MRVLFFGRLRDVAGAGELSLAAPLSTLADLHAHLARDNAALGEALAGPGIRVAIDQAFVTGDADFGPNAEIAFMPPLSGG